VAGVGVFHEIAAELEEQLPILFVAAEVLAEEPFALGIEVL
jgi:hypothetical protein